MTVLLLCRDEMAAAERNITFVAGDGYRHKFVFQQPDPDHPGQNIPIDVSGLEFAASVKTWWDSDVHEDFELDEAASDPPEGLIWMFLTSEQTANPDLDTRSVWDAQFNSVGNDPTTFVRGNCRISPQATA